MIVSICLVLCLLSERAWPQSTPLDSLYASDRLTLSQRMVLKPIQLWQRFSYASPGMNCQFHASCSNYMTAAILEKGIPAGLICGTDRLVRCNPAARTYHLERPGALLFGDGRLEEPLDWQPQYQSSKSPWLAVALSVVPGLGRTYAGHPWDGVFSFLLVSTFALNTQAHLKAENHLAAGIQGGVMLLFWSADLYGAVKTAQLAPP